MTLITRIADKAGTFGSILSAFGCAACFPAIASIGAALGMGFLQEYEGLFITRLTNQAWWLIRSEPVGPDPLHHLVVTLNIQQALFA